MSGVVYERLEVVRHERREFHPVGTTREEMAAAMEWVRSLGHEAASLEDDGFRYRSVYAEPSEYTGTDRSRWIWAEPGEWLVHMSGDRVTPELDHPHDSPDGTDFYLGPGDWHRLTNPSKETT